MADNQRTLELKILADIEVARNQLEKLVGVLGSTATEVDAKINRIEDSFDRAGKGISTKALALASGMGAAFGSFLGTIGAQIPAALKQIADSAIDSAGSIKNTAEQLGIGTDALQDFRIGASKAGVEVTQADAALNKFQETSGKAAAGGRTAAAAFKAIGVDIADSEGRLKPFEVLIGEVADGLAKLPDPARQSAAAVALFGSNGDKILPFLRGGSQGMNDLAEASEALGLKLSPETINKLDALGNTAGEIKKVINAQLASAIGENADAFLALGAGAVAAIDGVGQLLTFMRGFKRIVESEGLATAIFANDTETLAAGSAGGMRARLAGQVATKQKALDEAKAAAKGGSFIDRNFGIGTGTEIAQRVAERDQAAATLAQFDFRTGPPGAAGAPKPPGSGGAVVVAPPKPTRTARPARAAPAVQSIADFLKSTPEKGPSVAGEGGVLSLFNNPQAFLEPQRAAEKLETTLRGAFDAGNLDELINTGLPGLTDGLSEAEFIAQNITQDLAFGIAGIITQAGSLEDKLISVFSNIGASMLQSGILNFLSGGAQGVSFGSIVSSVGALFGGARAEGGPVMGGKAYLVGERGPEIMVPGMNGAIIPNHALRAGGRGGGGSTVQNFDLRGAVVTEQLYRQMQAIGIQAAQAGAVGGARMAGADSARRARRTAR